MSSYERVELKHLPPSFFLNNRKNFIKNLKERLVSIPENSFLFLMGGKDLYRYDNDDELMYFIQESNFYYLTGVLEANYYATINLTDATFSLYIPQPSEREKIFLHWETLEQIAEKYNEVIDHDELIYEILADTRTRKSTEEIELLKYINKATIEAHIDTMKKIYQNISKGKELIERDVENFFFSYIRSKLYSRNHPYEHICGCGVDGATLHYINNDKKLEKGKLILMDMGGLAAGYVSDVTSTVPVSGTFDETQKKIYNIVLDANREVMKRAKPGVSWVDMHLAAEEVILTGLKNLGLLKGDVKEMLNNRVCYYFMPHGLGHLMGLDVHDVGGYLSFTPERSKEKGLDCLRTARILEKNMILSDEPGIYFIPYLLEKGFNDEKVKKYFVQDEIKKYYEFGGVRIEDDILITDDGCVNLTEGLPRTVEEIEKTMKSE